MPWCPKCRNEYYEGFTVCSDCNCELVDELPELKEEKKLGGFLTDEDMTRMVSMQAMIEPQQEENSDFFDEIEAEDETANEAKRVAVKGVYRNYAEKAEDNKSSAATLLFVGFVGLIVVILSVMDIISLPLSNGSKVVVYGVMGAMFLLFIIMGIVSACNAKKYAKEATAENNLSAEIRKWCDENLTKEVVDKDLFTDFEEEFGEEDKYFKRFERMKELISEHFMNLEDDYLNRFIDEYYQEVF